MSDKKWKLPSTARKIDSLMMAMRMEVRINPQTTFYIESHYNALKLEEKQQNAKEAS